MACTRKRQHTNDGYNHESHIAPVRPPSEARSCGACVCSQDDTRPSPQSPHKFSNSEAKAGRRREAAAKDVGMPCCLAHHRRREPPC